MKFEIVVKAVIIDKNKLLIVKKSNSESYNPNSITLPAGHVNIGESLEEAIKREVKEETNLDIEALRVNTTWNFLGKEGNTEIIGISFLCKLLTKNTKLNNELQSFEWISLLKYKNFNLPKTIIKEIEEFIKSQ